MVRSQEHETPTRDDCTHSCFDKYSDWWCTPNAGQQGRRY